VYEVFRTTTEGIRRVEARADLVQTARILLERFRADLASAYPMMVEVGLESGFVPGGQEEFTTQQITFIAEDDYDPSTEQDLDNLRFTCATNDPRLREEATFDLYEVFYYVDLDEETEEEGLVRRCNYWPGLATETTEEEVIEISPLVRGLNLRFLEEITAEQEEIEWLDTWEDTTRLPAAVEITLVLTPPKAREQSRQEEGIPEFVYTTVVRLPLREPVKLPPLEEPEERGPGGEGLPEASQQPAEAQPSGSGMGATLPPTGERGRM